MPNIEVQPMGYALGAKVTGVDLSKPLAADTIEQIKAAWTKHLVLVFPDQQLDPETLIAFTRHFGELDNYETQPFNRHPEHDEVMLLSNKPVNGKMPAGAYNGQNWHTDLSYTPRPAKATMVYCIQKPSVGGDTMFANMYAAYESLSPKMQAFLDDLEGVNDVSLISARRDPAILEAFKRLNPPVVHPAVRIHPESGKPALYVNDRVRTFVGMSDAESKPIIRFLCEHSQQPRFVYRHRWSVRDLVLWDNRCLTHLAVGDYDPSEIRHMIRTSTMGDYYGRFENPEAVEAARKAAATTDKQAAAAASLLHD
ncbi:TauD/TfdA family dioxygenase [Caenimonas sp. SL110]|uniref:TauD/TfdA dioxygenase family protein n=1 Tax=Caenimonas sp. SL110 TaxID=1450524 RepID=UPI000654319C|nr:TauD/TfdA family dioxygenase [Caenimonas sp. SL110]